MNYVNENTVSILYVNVLIYGGGQACFPIYIDKFGWEMLMLRNRHSYYIIPGLVA